MKPDGKNGHAPLCLEDGCERSGNEPEQKKAKPPRTHWDMLLERRSIAELEDILNERLQEVRTRRGRAS